MTVPVPFHSLRDLAACAIALGNRYQTYLTVTGSHTRTLKGKMALLL